MLATHVVVMKIYRVVWSLVGGALCAVAIAAACVAWTPGGVVLAYALATLIVGCGLMLLPGADGSVSFDLGNACRSLRSSVPLGAVALVVLALLDTTGWMAGPLLVVAGASSPHVIGWAVNRNRSAACGRRLARRSSPPAEQEQAWELLVGGEVARLSDADLCWAWRISYQTLQECTDPDWRGQVAVVRATYLTELERRHPVQIAAWLASGPLPTNGPERFLRA